MQLPRERAEYLEFLEKGLRAAIQSQTNNKEAKKLIKMPNMNLSKRDENGRSFLAIALEAGNEEIATLLFDKQKNYDDIIYGVDLKGRNLFLLALGLPQKPSQNFIDLLLEHAKINGKKPWLHLDNEGSSSLFAAVRSLNPVTVQKILDLFKQESNCKELINHNLYNGDTALHVACQLKVVNVVAQLVNNGASLNPHNNDHLTFFSLFSDFSRKEQQAVFLLLTREKKTEFLSEFLRCSNRNQIEANHNVYVLASLDSLQALVRTNLEFNKLIAPRRTYIHTKGDEQGNIEISEFEIPEGILNKIPLYAKRNGFIVDLALIEKIYPSSLHVIDEDRSSLLQLRNEINNLLQNLQNRGLLSWQMKKTIQLTFPILYICCAVSFFVGFVTSGAIMSEFLLYSSVLIVLLLIVTVGALHLFLFSRGITLDALSIYHNPEVLAQSIPALSRTILKSEWQEFTPNLSHIKDKLKENTGAITFSNNQLVNDFQNILLPLSEDQPIVTAVQLLTSIYNMLSEIVNDINRTKKPLSLYFKSARKPESVEKESTIIEVFEDRIKEDDEDSHDLPLLRRVSL